MPPSTIKHFFLIFSALFFIFHTQALAQDDLEIETRSTAALNTTLENLNSIDSSIRRLQKNLASKQQLLRSPEAQGREAEINEDIQTLAHEINLLENNFRQLAANVDLDNLLPQKSSEDFSLLNELEKLLKPILSQLENITALPREIENLKELIAQQDKKLDLLKRAELHTQQLAATTEPGENLKTRLQNTTNYWAEQRKNLETSQAIARQRLNSRLAQQTPIGESLSNVFQTFFKTRGKNIFLAVLAAGIFYLLLQRIFLITQNSAQLKQKRLTGYNRLIILVYILLSAIGTTLIFVTVLYLTGDWLLLTLTLFLLLGLLWASRETLPRFWSQLVLLLNMGPVREGELVVYDGLPWKVEKLHLYTHLANTHFSSGSLKVPIMDLISLRSRVIAEHENLFPTNKNDWILFRGEKLGEVVLQTPSIVQIKELGGRLHNIKTSEFLLEPIVNLSQGFRVYTSFGLDYKHQAEITDKIPSQLKDFLISALKNTYPIQELKICIEFEAAGNSSLNLAVIIDFPGQYAKDFKRLQRLVPRICVEACNQFDWIIPFEQVVVHMEKN